MAQPTVTSRPSTWSGTSGPILYKFTSTNYANAGYYMAVEIWNSTTAAKVADAKFYANSTGTVTVNVQTFLRDNMSLNNNSDLTAGSTYTDNNWIKYYIKYRELWTASSEAQVDDVANLRYAVYGGLQIGSANNLSNYVCDGVTKLFLLLADSPYFVKNYPFTFSAIVEDNTCMLVKRHIGANIYYSRITIANSGSRAQRIKYLETGEAETIDISLNNSLVLESIIAPSSWNPLTSTWTFGATTITKPSGNIQNDVLALQPLVCLSGTRIKFTISVDITFITTGSVYIEFRTYNSLVTQYDSWVSTQITTTGVTSWDVDITTTQDTAYLYLLAGSLLTNEVIIITFPVGAYIGIDPAAKSETKTFTKLESCDNIVMLQWKNSLGGDECYPFQVNQEYTFNYGDRKAKRLTLFAENLTLNQWEAIQGLNTNGDLYKTPITEMTTSLNRTMATVGQAVYVYNSDGTKIGVNVINTPNTTNTKQKTHSATITIEYPEQFLQ